ncbi:MAG: aminopeptidase P family protein [Spirochaetales bacterium]|nr:MAG: aminopeptidase P family protein [Spirochaetales bacterium]
MAGNNIMHIRRQTPFDAAKLAELMKEAGVELLLASTRHNTRYLTGGYYYPLYMWDAHARRTQYLSFVCIPRGSLDDSFFVGRPGEEEVMAEADAWPGLCYEAEKITSLSTAARTVEVLKERKLDALRIALELPSVPADVFGILKDQLPRAEFFDAVPIMDKLRAVKRPGEVKKIRDGTGRIQDALAAVLTSGREGLTTAEIANQAAKEFRKRDLHFLYALVCAGPGFFRAPSEKRIWRRNQVLHIDAGGMLDGYIVELCRMGCLGRPSSLAGDLLQGCRDLEKAVRDLLRPGVKACDVQQGANDFLDEYPLGAHGRFIAHGIGMVHHEDPVINTNSGDLLQEGMILSIEMEFLHDEAGHVKIENMVEITGTGNELLSSPGNDWYLSNP